MTTSLPIVPSKFYQVCRLCMNVVSDTNDLVNLSVFGRSNASSCIGSSAHCEIAESTTNSGVIVKTATTKTGKLSARKLSTTRKSSTHSDNDNNTDGSNAEHDNNDDDQTTVTNNSSDNEAAGTDDVTADDDEAILNNNNNFKIDSSVNSQQSDVLERIQTFLSITVSVFIHFILFSFFFRSHLIFSTNDLHI